MSPNAPADDHHDDIMYPSAVPFLLVHLGCVAAIWSGVTWQAVAICISLYVARMFGIGAGYHRYFSHRAFATSRVFQFILACLAQSSAQKSVLWWAAKHRHHHLHSDTEIDVHSPRHRGFVYSHLGWIFYRRHDATDLVKVSDLAAYPELMWLHRLELLPAIVLAALCFLVAGWSGLVVGFLWSTVLLYHATFCINSLAHVHGRKRYVTGDDSRNNWLLALFTLGEGWHNNHHAYQSSVRQGFRWWEVDVTYYVLKVLSWLGIVWNMKAPPEQVLRNEQPLGARVINRAAIELAERFDAQKLAQAISSARRRADLAQLQLPTLHDILNRAHESVDALAHLHLPKIPTREEFLAEAKAIFARTRSLNEIVDHAYEHFLASVHAQLVTVR
ncbi:acyl-CoA desaturase [Bradyrhizobium frederickii]|uniref:Acyl-CoA desaturase n=1 Tax=Bradyrhizobium frederickii TaxID=2560054 RepID=A0A4Y9KVR9_9BRAD|nr:fatty acid desaturase [Bradyrhizobium frederickii]TFV35458.1 acyl-CoA desaturase [Bradyrhizobium frederickii]